ncbi:pyruvate kinase [Aureococcus anophagefferens]|nr:pyruvate kinase [Aureococcus anophagefferens]
MAVTSLRLQRLASRLGYPRRPASSLTKIVATIGPASEDLEPLKACVASGFEVMRLNFSHATEEEFFRRVHNLAKCDGGHKVATLLDTRGPEVRLGGLKVCKDSGDRKAKVALEAGSTLLLTGDAAFDGAGDATTMYVNYPGLDKVVEVGDSVLLDDGLVILEVAAADASGVTCTVTNSNAIGERKGVNIPGAPLGLPPLSDKDQADVAFGVANGIDFVAASFIGDAAGVEAVRAFVESLGALDELDGIVDASDGVMVARGDLGVEVPIASVATWQKTIVGLCRAAGKPVIVATQMLESMQKNPRPTRAEVADVTNAALELADAVMLSGESANGDYPALALKTQRDILKAAEAWDDELYDAGWAGVEPALALPLAAVHAQRAAGAAALAVVEDAGGARTRGVAQCAPDVPVVALAASARVARQLALSRGVAPVHAPGAADLDAAAAAAAARAELGLAADAAVVVYAGDAVSLL